MHKPTDFQILLEGPNNEVMVLVPFLKRELLVGEHPDVRWRDMVVIGKAEKGIENEARIVNTIHQYVDGYGAEGLMYRVVQMCLFNMTEPAWIFNTDKPFAEALEALSKDPNYPRLDVVKAALAEYFKPQQSQ